MFDFSNMDELKPSLVRNRDTNNVFPETLYFEHDVTDGDMETPLLVTVFSYKFWEEIPSDQEKGASVRTRMVVSRGKDHSTGTDMRQSSRTNDNKQSDGKKISHPYYPTTHYIQT